MRKFLVLSAFFLSSLLSLSLKANPALSLEELQRQSEQALAELHVQLAAQSGDWGRRNRDLLVLAQRSEETLPESELEWLEQYAAEHSADRFSKLYSGYGWLQMAKRYMQQQNYFRAAELAKRGFFLIDEAVDEHPEDWRLRVLRARLDAVLPAEFGRYVIALADLQQLEQTPELAASLQPLLSYLRVRALYSAEQPEAAQQALNALQNSPLHSRAQANQSLFLTTAEIEHVLQAALEMKHE